MADLRTPYRKKLEARDFAILAEWQELTADPSNSREKIRAHLMRKYKLYSRSSIHEALKRAQRKFYGDDDSRAE